MGMSLQEEEEEVSRSCSWRREREREEVVPPFLTKTYELVDDPKTDEIVSWGDTNDSFVVWRAPEFARDLLPNYFKHNNFSSFVRQLNTYGFRKIVTERWEFANEFFRKGEKHLLSDIHRRCKSSSDAGGLVSSPTPLSSSSNSSSSFIINNLCPTSSVEAIAVSLCHENERLRTNNALLLHELTRLRKLYTDVVTFVHQNHTNHHIVLPNHSNNQLSSLSHYKSANNNNGQLSLPCLQSSSSASPLSIKETQLQLAGSGKSNTAHHRSADSMINERDYDKEETTVKLFGVPLHETKRLRLSVSAANSRLDQQQPAVSSLTEDDNSISKPSLLIMQKPNIGLALEST